MQGRMRIAGWTQGTASSSPATQRVMGAQPQLRFAKSIVARSAGNGANGAVANGASRVEGGTIEMYVASADDLEELYNSDTPAAQTRKSVTPPRNAAPQALSAPGQADTQEVSLTKLEPVEYKILQAELSMANDELRTARAELQRSEHSVRERSREVTMLRAALAERDSRLRSAKAELTTAQAALKDKDAELQASYHQLLSSAQERGLLRQQLLDSQRELADMRTELEAWTQARIKGGGADGEEGPDQAALPAPSATPVNTIAKMLETLSQLSQQVADDALADEATFKEKDLV